MGTKTWIAVGIVVVGAGAAAAAYLLSHPSKLVTSRPNAEIAPASLVAYVEADDVAGLRARLESKESWGHLRESALLEEFRASPTGKAWTDLMTRLETGAGYRIDGDRAMHFVGRQVSFGIDAVPESGDPAWLVLAKLDVDALVGELLEGKGDWTKLHAELERRTGAMDFAVAKSEHRGFPITSATRGGVSFHASLLGDTLAVSDSPALLHRAIDVLETGMGSLAQSMRYREEMKRLPAGAAVRQWVDLTALRGQRELLGRWADVRDSTGRASGAALRVLEGTGGAPSLACAIEVPDGDLYSLRWEWSRTAAELAGGTSPATLTHLVQGSPFTLELHDPMRVVKAWEGSALRRRVADGPIGRKLDEWTTKFEELRDELPMPLQVALGGEPSFGPGMDMDDEDWDDEEDGDEGEEEEGDGEDDEGDDAEDGEEADDDAEEEEAPAAPALASRVASDRFAMKMGLHLLWEGVTSCLHGDAVVAADPLAEGDDPEFVCAARLGTDGHLLWLAAEGVGLAEDELSRRGGGDGAVVYSAKLPSEAGVAEWTHLGDVMAFSNTSSGLERLVERAKSPASAAAAAPQGIPDGWCVLGTWNDTAFRDALVRFLPPGDDRDRLTSSLPKAGGFAVYVDDAFRGIELRYRYGMSQGIRLLEGPAEPKSFAWLPAETITALGAQWDVPGTLAWLRRTLGEDGSRMVDGALESGSEALAMDLERELLPAIGPEIAFALTYVPAPPSVDDDPPVFVPGLLLTADVRDEAAVAKALDGVLGILEKARSEASGREAASLPTVSRVVRDQMTELRFEFPQGPGAVAGVLPTVALGKGRLLIGLGDAVVAASEDAGTGRAPGFPASPLRERIRAVVPEFGSAWWFLDWNRLLDQIGEYAPHFAELVAPDVLPDGRKEPEFPDDPDEAAWERYEKEIEAWGADARKAGLERARRWIEAARLVDFVVGTGDSTESYEERRFLVRFAE